MTAGDRNQSSDEDRTVLAGELALGLAADRNAIALTDPMLKAEVEQWEEDFASFADEVDEAPPDPRLWRRLEAEIDRESPPKAVVARAKHQTMRGWLSGLLASLAVWRSLSVAGLAAAALLAALLIGRGDDAPPRNADPAPATANVMLIASLLPQVGSPTYVVSYEASRRTIFAVPAAIRVEPDEFPQLWLVRNETDPPIALGTLDPAGPQAIVLSASDAELVSVTAGLVITLEPRATVAGEAEGPVIAHARFTSL